MVKLVILFKQPANQDVFETGYVQNLALLEKLPAIIRRQACFVRGSPEGQSPYYRILELYFQDFDALDRALVSAEGRAAGADLIEFTGSGVELIFADVYED